MNPFTTPSQIFVYDRPQDMRAGIDRLSQVVAAEMRMSPADGSLYVFVSRDRRTLKMLRFEAGAWCMWQVRLATGRLRWEWGAGGAPLEVARRDLLWILEGLGGAAPAATRPATLVI
jgi:hypothetical protein